MNMENIRRPLAGASDKRTNSKAEAKSKRKPASVAKILAMDLLILAVLVAGFALYQFVLPLPYAVVESSESAAQVSVTITPAVPATSVAAVGRAATVTTAPASEVTATVPTAAATAATAAPAPVNTSGDLGAGKFAGKFTTGDVVSTATSYASANVNVTLSEVQQDGVTCYVEDIYVRNITNMRSAFAQNTYGKSIVDWPLDMAVRNGAIAAINGDYYGTGTIGTVIRNGKLYSSRVDGDVLILFNDGTMKVYAKAEFDADAVMAAGAYQAWSFGPSLLDANGNALSGFRGGISGLNPRTAIGYYEPGHYVFVVVDGRQTGYSDGVSLDQLAQLMDNLGVKVAYNLDGGKTSQMTFGDALVNQPTQGGRTTSDIIYVGE